MAIYSMLCTQCKDAEMNFEITIESAEDGVWYTAGLIDNSKTCACVFTDAQQTILEGDASFEYADAIHSREPDI